MKKIMSMLLVLCLCLLPMAALAQSPDDYPVSHSDFELSFHLNADGFPNDGAAHYQDWETFLDKISIRGEADIRRFLHPLSRTYVNAAIFLNGKSVVPFEYDNYYSDFRYLRSAALGGASVFFHFRNFLQFMLKG